MVDSLFYRLDNQGNLILRLRIQPRASKDTICGPLGDRLKIRITAPPLDGRANEHLLRFLSRELGVGGAQLSLSGEQSKEKTVRISGISGEDQKALLAWCRRQSVLGKV